ncbi:hypothetical protein A6R68_16319 [Neotoma lepida]|uniref:Uncharacterized protein n=1 Tax=Neotoma lepida TaxID=56216 RepID=A0A1A6HHU2_NEOLE|nr:hypothetical protein A6R68_16319 [Neotoma lepida]
MSLHSLWTQKFY